MLSAAEEGVTTLMPSGFWRLGLAVPVAAPGMRGPPAPDCSPHPHRTILQSGMGATGAQAGYRVVSGMRVVAAAALAVLAATQQEGLPEEMEEPVAISHQYSAPKLVLTGALRVVVVAPGIQPAVVHFMAAAMVAPGATVRPGLQVLAVAVVVPAESAPLEERGAPGLSL